MRGLIATFVCLLLLWPQNAGISRESASVDIKMVLAVDASGSVDRDELKLQLKGIAEAFRDQEIQSAIARGTFRKILVSMLIWSDAAYAKHPTKWFLIDSSRSAEKFARKVEKLFDRHGALTALGGGGTGLGSGLAFAVGMINENRTVATRNIIDISGDGRESRPWNKGAVMLPEARAIAAAQGVTVNGLAIETDISNLTRYFRDYVLVGPGSFAIAATDFLDYKRAIRKKLLRELSPVAIGLKGARRNWISQN